MKKSVTSQQGDDRKLQAALKKLGVQPITGVEEVNMFKEDGNVLHFAQPRREFLYLTLCEGGLRGGCAVCLPHGAFRARRSASRRNGVAASHELLKIAWDTPARTGCSDVTRRAKVKCIERMKDKAEGRREIGYGFIGKKQKRAGKTVRRRKTGLLKSSGRAPLSTTPIHIRISSPPSTD